MTPEEEKKIRKQLKKYDEEAERGIMHTEAYDIKMYRYRLALSLKYPKGGRANG